MASQKQLEAKAKQAQTTADDWLRRAELAVAKGEDELAREALKRRKTYQAGSSAMKLAPATVACIAELTTVCSMRAEWRGICAAPYLLDIAATAARLQRARHPF